MRDSRVSSCARLSAHVCESARSRFRDSFLFGTALSVSVKIMAFESISLRARVRERVPSRKLLSNAPSPASSHRQPISARLVATLAVLVPTLDAEDTNPSGRSNTHLRDTRPSEIPAATGLAGVHAHHPCPPHRHRRRHCHSAHTEVVQTKYIASSHYKHARRQLHNLPKIRQVRRPMSSIDGLPTEWGKHRAMRVFGKRLLL